MADTADPMAGPDASSTLGFAALRRAGIAHLQRLSGGTWTDHNTHDPGITILEQLCYAITDLGYRTGHALPDLLARAGDDGYASLHTPAQVLPSAPVTLLDLRKQVLDIAGVKNAWVEAVDEPTAVFNAVEGEISWVADAAAAERAAKSSPNVTPIRVRGLYRVLIEKSEFDDVDGSAIRREAAARLLRCRALGADLEAVEVLRQQAVALRAALEVDSVDDPVALLARINEAVAGCLSPTVPLRSLAEMRQRGLQVDDIFEGPLLAHGFIADEDLARSERRRSVHLSDLISALMAVPGVTAVKNLAFIAADGTPTRDWVLEIAPDSAPRFDLRASTLRFDRRGLQREVQPAEKEAALRSLSARRAGTAAAAAPTAADADAELLPPRGRDRRVAAYLPVQQQFPANYGIGDGGLALSAPPARRAQARQLQAYLMFFDQLLANHFAQLAGVGTLLSYHEPGTDSYFSAAIGEGDVPGLQAIRKSDAQAHAVWLQQATEDPEPRSALPEQGARRRNRFLDHLLARHGQDIAGWNLLEAAGAGSDAASTLARLAQRKQAFLREIAAIGHERGLGCRLLEAAGPDNRSGLERLLRHKLGIDADEEPFHLVEHVLLRPLPGDAGQQGPLLRAADGRDPYSLQLSLVFPDWGRFAEPGLRRFVEQTVHEEVPAHLTARVVWKDAASMQALQSALAGWFDRLREQRRRLWGL